MYKGGVFTIGASRSERDYWRVVILSLSVLAILLLVACGGGADTGETGNEQNPPGTLLYIGPHPDDEFYAAPLFGHLCRDEGWACTFVVVTRGEGGTCNLSGGCNPDLETVRMAEMTQSAQLLGANLIHWDLGDNGQSVPYAGDVEDVLTLWANYAGGVSPLLALVQKAIQDTQPDVIYTMDPRHGNYCHPTHRAIGAVVVDAVNGLGTGAPETRLLAGKFFSNSTDFGFQPVVPTDSTLNFFDSTTPSGTLGEESWLFTLRVMQTHQSQFNVQSTTDQSFLATADANKRIWWVLLSEVTPGDTAYSNLCPPSTF